MAQIDSQDWVLAYQEIVAEIKNKVPLCKHIDLWYDQTNQFEQEYPFASPAVFLEFESNEITDKGDNGQLIDMSIRVYAFWETTADSYEGSDHQLDGLEFANYIKSVHVALQNLCGVHFSPLNRTALRKEPSPAYAHLWSQTYNTIITDNSSALPRQTQLLNADQLTTVKAPTVPVEYSKLFDINL